MADSVNPMARQDQELDFIAPKVAAEVENWLHHLGAERRLSPKTLEAYRRDVMQFLGFLAHHLGGAPSLKDLAALTPADVRAFMAARRGQGIGSRSLMRMLAGTRAFARFLEREARARSGHCPRCVRPRLPRRCRGRLPSTRQPTWPIPTSPPATAASLGFMPATPPCSRCSMAAACGFPKHWA